MPVTISGPKKLRGEITPPGDKSVSHRAAIFNAIASGDAVVTNFSPGADCSSSVAVLRSLGVEIDRSPGRPGFGDTLHISGAGMNGLHQAIKLGEDQIARLPHLNCLRGIDDVRGGKTEVQPAGGRPYMLGHRSRKRNDVMLGDFFDLFDAGDVEGTAFTNVARGIGWYDAGSRHGLGGCHFDLQPRFVLPLVAPDATHLRMRVTPDHLSEITLQDGPRTTKSSA